MPMDFPSPATAGQTFSPPGGPQYVFTNGTWRMQGAPTQTTLQDAASDMSIGFKTAGNRFVVNDKSDLTGTDVMQMAETGSLTAAGYIYASGGRFVGSTSAVTLANGSGAGTVNLRPNGEGSTTGQTTIDSIGNLTAAGHVQAASGGVGSGAGTLYLRPNGYGSGTGQTYIDSSGTMTVAASITAGGSVYGGAIPSGTGANEGSRMQAGLVSTSRTVTTSIAHHVFYTPNGTVGAINTSGSATAYATSSDERLKDFTGLYDPQEAITIIRADPVRSFKWKTDGTDAVGWGAQTSWAISHDLAQPPPDADLAKEPGDEDFQPWGIDQGRRTPYLWAALSWALDKIDALEARIEALEAG